MKPSTVHKDLVQRVLDELCDRDREILMRFYLNEQSEAQICSEMDLTESQFRLVKSDAKARFHQLSQEKSIYRPPSGTFQESFWRSIPLIDLHFRAVSCLFQTAAGCKMVVGPRRSQPADKTAAQPR